MVHDPKFQVTIGSILVIATLSFLFFLNSGCEMNPGGGGPSVGTGTISGIVKDVEGRDLINVTVNGGGKTANTNIDGKFTLANVPAASNILVKFDKAPNYVPTYQNVKLVASGNVYLTPRMMFIGTSEPLPAATGGTVSDGDGSISINGNTLKYPNGSDVTGDITVQFTSYDPTVTPEFQAFPGDFAGRLTESGTDFAFETFGYINVTVMQGTTKLTLNGTAELHIPVPANLRSNPDLPEPTIDLWSYNETLGYWIHEGVATLEQPGHEFYRAIINHFSYWNCDMPYITGYISGEVVDIGGLPVEGAYVKINPIGWYGATPYWGYITGANGKFCIPVKAQSQTEIYAVAGLSASTSEFIPDSEPPVQGIYTLPYPLVLSGSLLSIESVVITNDRPRMLLGGQIGLVAEARSMTGNPIGGKSFEWWTSNSSIATVDASGANVNVYGNSLGTCTIYASCEGFIGTRLLTVETDIWMNVGDAGFSTGGIGNPSIYVYSGTPYVGYPDSARGTKATVMKYTGTTWEAVGDPGFSKGIIGYLSLQIYNGTPYVAYKDNANGNKATVMKYTGTTWEAVGDPGFSAGQANYTSLFIYSDTPYIAYQDDAYGTKATVMKYTGTTWEAVGDPGFSGGQAFKPSLYVYGGTPYLSYRDGAYDSKATVMKYTGTTWEAIGDRGFTIASGESFPLYIFSGTPYVAYQDAANGYKATVMKYTGTTWEAVGAPGFSAGVVYSISLSVTSGTPYVAYQDAANGYKATVMKYTGTAWEAVGNPGFSAGQASYTYLYIFSGTPYVAYQDAAYSYKATVMKYGH